MAEQQLKTQNTAPLNVTREASHRVFVGLGWDPNQKLSLKDKIGSIIGQREIYHDLDLTCYFCNRDKVCLGYVSADSGSESNESKSIYHSGDSIEGVGDGDDEQISIELKNLPPNIHYLIFKASIKSGHHFSEIEAPEIRLCDGYTGRCFLQTSIEPPPNGEYDAFIFASLSRNSEPSADGVEWQYTNLHKFVKDASSQDWETLLSQYLK